MPVQDDPITSTKSGVGFRASGSVMTESIAGGLGAETSSLSVVGPVPTATTQTFQLVAFLDGGTETIAGTGRITAITAPFGASS
jgi:hypothetical protein